MMGSLLRSMSWLHTWGGLLIGWLLLAIFLTGAASIFKQEIHVWTRPEAPISASPDQAMTRAYEWFAASEPDAAYWHFWAPSPRNPSMESYWTNADGEFEVAMLDPRTGGPLEGRETLGGEMFYRFHFELDLPYPWGRWLACLAAMSMLVALVSGVIVHKRFFKDFFVFRPNKSGQRAWLDAHNVSSVLILPFHFMIAFTGLVTLMGMLMPWSMLAAYGEDYATFYRDRYGDSFSIEASGVPAPMAPIDLILRESHARFHGPISRILVERPGDANARIEVFASDDGHLSSSAHSLIFDGVTGELREERIEHHPAALTEDILYGLHMGRFGGVLLRWLYFFCGLAGAGMIATGMVLWSVKRQPKNESAPFHFGLWLVERLNVGAIMGIPLAMASFFWANRLLPFGLEARGDWESRTFLITMAAAWLYAAVRPARRAWIELGVLVAFAFAGLPFLNACTTSRGLPGSLGNGDSIMATADLLFLVIGLGFATAVWTLLRVPAQRKAKA